MRVAKTTRAATLRRIPYNLGAIKSIKRGCASRQLARPEGRASGPCASVDPRMPNTVSKETMGSACNVKACFRGTARQCYCLVLALASILPAVAQELPTAAATRSTDSAAESAPFRLDQLDFRKLNNQQFDLHQTPEQFQPLIIDTVLDLVPKDYENSKKWGRTKEIVSGLDVKFRDGQLRTKRRRKEVNHGTWKRYTVTLVDPKKYFELQVLNLNETSPGVAAFDLLVRAKLDVYGRLQEWARGVRLYSISADAVADVQLTLHCELTTKLDSKHLPPDILLKPNVLAADAKLVQFKLHRLSKADGPIVREFGDGLEKLLRKKLVEKNEKLASKINRQIAKNEDDLRISFREMLSSGLFGGDSDGKQNDDDTQDEPNKTTSMENRATKRKPNKTSGKGSPTFTETFPNEYGTSKQTTDSLSSASPFTGAYN